MSDKKLILDFINETLLSKHGVVKGKFADGKFLVQQHRLLSQNREVYSPTIPAYWLVEQNDMEIFTISRHNSQYTRSKVT